MENNTPIGPGPPIVLGIGFFVIIFSAILNAFTIAVNTFDILATLLTSFNSLFNCLVSLFFLATRPWKSLSGGHVFFCACDNEVIPNETNSFKAKGINLSFILFTSLFIVSVTIASGDFSANLFSSLIVFSSKTKSLDVSFSSDFSRLSNSTTLIRVLSLPSNFNGWCLGYLFSEKSILF